MGRKTKRANGFQRTRDDHASEIREDYLEAIWEIASEHGQCRGTDLARLFHVSHATVTQTIARLKKDGLVESERYGPIKLTKKGMRVAKASRERHLIVLQFLRHIGVSEQMAEHDAEGIEHHVSDETLDCLRSFVGKHD